MCYRRLLTIKILLILLLGSLGITCRAVASEAQPVGIGLTREASAAPLFIAVEEGYFAAEGLEPHLTFFNDDSSVSAAVASGILDIGFAALSSSFFSVAAGHDLKMIASRSSDQTRFPMHVLLMKKEVHSARLDGIRELTGARIGVSDTGSSAYYALFDIGSRFGLASDAIKTVSLKSSGDELRALSRREIDAALLPYPIALHSATRQELTVAVEQLRSMAARCRLHHCEGYRRKARSGRAICARLPARNGRLRLEFSSIRRRWRFHTRTALRQVP